MDKIKEEELKEIYQDIVSVMETENVAKARRVLKEGARLLCVTGNPRDYEYAALYILGWPEGTGKEIPFDFENPEQG